MNTGLSKNTRCGIYDQVMINVWCLATKTIVFTGDRSDVAKFAGTYEGMISSYLRTKSRFRKKYVFRFAKAV